MDREHAQIDCLTAACLVDEAKRLTLPPQEVFTGKASKRWRKPLTTNVQLSPRSERSVSARLDGIHHRQAMQKIPGFALLFRLAEFPESPGAHIMYSP